MLGFIVSTTNACSTTRIKLVQVSDVHKWCSMFVMFSYCFLLSCYCFNISFPPLLFRHSCYLWNRGGNSTVFIFLPSLVLFSLCIFALVEKLLNTDFCQCSSQPTKHYQLPIHSDTMLNNSPLTQSAQSARNTHVLCPQRSALSYQLEKGPVNPEGYDSESSSLSTLR